MNKCDFCQHSVMRNGKLVCNKVVCLLSQKDIIKILEELEKIKK